MMVCPDASFEDGMFDILVVHQISIEFLKVLPKVFSGRHVGHPAVQILRGEQVRLEVTASSAMPTANASRPFPGLSRTCPPR